MDKVMRGSPSEFEAILELCRTKQRRIMLAVLAENPRPLTVNDLTKTIVKHKYRSPITEISQGVTERIQMVLHHEHIPKMEAAGIVEYDQERELVKPTERFDRLSPMITRILEVDPTLETPIEL